MAKESARPPRRTRSTGPMGLADDRTGSDWQPSARGGAVRMVAPTIRSLTVLLLLSAIICAPSPSPASAAATALQDGVHPAHLLAEAREIEGWIVDIRRELHQHPELNFDLPTTSAIVRRHLDQLGIRYRFPLAGSGIVATIGGGSGPTIALRADMDALPILEDNGSPFDSQNPGVMHACGHDAHISMLLGAARLLKYREAGLEGTVRLLFQPGEEQGAGANVMIQQGALEGVDAAFAMHVWPWLESGKIASRAGPIMAGASSFQITVQGRGGHAAMPHMASDPVVAASAIVIALQTLVSRETSPLSSALVSVTVIRAGDAHNVIPSLVTLGGTFRALTYHDMETLRRRIREVSEAQAASLGCSAAVDYMEAVDPYYPPTVNNPAMHHRVTRAFSRMASSGSAAVVETEPVMPAEDFSFVAKKVPACLAFLGIGNATAGSDMPLHTSRFAVDESVLASGAALHASVALSFMADNAQAEAAGDDEVSSTGPSARAQQLHDDL